MANRHLPPYRDLDDYYPRPATGDTGGAGWCRQAADNLSVMLRATALPASGGLLGGTIAFGQSWVGVTQAGSETGLYLRVGQMCYLWAGAQVGNLTSTPAGLELPVAPADSLLSMIAGAGTATDASTQIHPFVAVIESGALRFYWAETATNGAVIQGDPWTTSGSCYIGVFAAYRVAPAEEGYLNTDYAIDTLYPPP